MSEPTTVRHVNDPRGYDLYIGRAVHRKGLRLSQSKWANPFKIGADGDRESVLDAYHDYILLSPDLLAALPELKGKVLGCWCAPKACHGDVLAEMANALLEARA